MTLSAEFLRVHSPSAEVKGHGKPKLVTGKAEVGIDSVVPVGQYGVRIGFNDGHDTGLYTWEYLKTLGINQDQLWKEYLDQCDAQGDSEQSDFSPVRWRDS